MVAIGCQEFLGAFMILLALLFLMMILFHKPVPRIVCPKCQSTNYIPDHAIGCNRCHVCGTWFQMMQDNEE